MTARMFGDGEVVEDNVFYTWCNINTSRQSVSGRFSEKAF